MANTDTINSEKPSKSQKSTPASLLKQLCATAAVLCYDHCFGLPSKFQAKLVHMYHGNEDLNILRQNTRPKVKYFAKTPTRLCISVWSRGSILPAPFMTYQIVQGKILDSYLPWHFKNRLCFLAVFCLSCRDYYAFYQAKYKKKSLYFNCILMVHRNVRVNHSSPNLFWGNLIWFKC